MGIEVVLVSFHICKGFVLLRVFVALSLLCSTAIMPSSAHLSHNGLPGVVRTESAQTLGHGKLGLSIGAHGHVDDQIVRERRFLHYQSSVVRVPDTTNISELQSGSISLNVAIGISDYFDLGLGLPIHADMLPEDFKTNKMTAAGIGDFKVTGKLQYPPYEHSKVFDMALWGQLSFPSGSKSKGFLPKEVYYIPKDSSVTNHFYSASKHSIATMMLWTFDPSYLKSGPPLRFHLNYGLLSTLADHLDNQFQLNMAAEWFPYNFLTLFSEFSGQTRLEQFESGFNIGDDPMIASFGFSVDAPNGVFFTFAFDKGLSKTNYNTMRWSNKSSTESFHYDVKPVPNYAISLILGYSAFLVPQDRDGDGINDKDDRCPDEKEDIDGFEDKDGCPDPDNDQDGISDLNDKCPMEAEDKDGFEDSDGCPDIDNDKDGILDLRDKCPMQAEDMDGFEDTDGCPDLDNDKDGILDSLDRCPNEAEDFDGFEDSDGCPDLDNDKDGIPDLQDQCPNEAENMNGVEDEDGCPEKVKAIEKQVVLHGVNFKTGSSDLLPESYPKLNEVVEQLKTYPDVIIEIRGYTDNIGNDNNNLKLSEGRAQSVRSYLLSQGVNPTQVKAQGMGKKFPIANNRTAEGRAQNRRIEMYRLK